MADSLGRSRSSSSRRGFAATGCRSTQIINALYNENQDVAAGRITATDRE